MDFKEASKLSLLIAKEYAEDFFKLLVNYKDISASEAASRLDLHTKTAQDFLETLEKLGIVSKKEVSEKKRPYFRYSLKTKKLLIKIDLQTLTENIDQCEELKWNIRERKNSGAVFRASRSGEQIQAVHFFIGKDRQRKERILNLTKYQGEFLFHLPFPVESSKSVRDIILKAKIPDSCIPEIVDLIRILIEHNVIEKETPDDSKKFTQQTII